MRFITRRMDARISLTSPAISAVMRLRCGCEADDNGASCSEALTPGAQPVTLLWGAESGSAAGYIFIRSRIGERSRLHFIRSRIGERSRLHLVIYVSLLARPTSGPKRETFGNFLRCSASSEATQISQKFLRKPDPPKSRKTFRETLARGKPLPGMDRPSRVGGSAPPWYGPPLPGGSRLERGATLSARGF
jgi:hypothetical protein